MIVHAKEPWQVWKLSPDSDRQERWIITSGNGEEEITTIIEDETTAERIVTCVNALAGLSEDEILQLAQDQQELKLLKADLSSIVQGYQEGEYNDLGVDWVDGVVGILQDWVQDDIRRTATANALPNPEQDDKGSWMDDL